MKVIPVFPFCLILFLSFSNLHAQHTTDFDNEAVQQRLKTDLSILASDSFEGRAAGSPGEQKAANYIVDQLIKTGLSPYFGDTAFTQKFSSSYILFGRKNSYLLIDNQYIPQGTKNTCFYPLAYTGTASIEGKLLDVNFGINAPALDYNDYAKVQNLDGQIAVIETSIPGGFTLSSPFEEYRYIRKKIDTASVYGASAVIFVNSDPHYTNPTNDLNLSVIRREIPILFYNGQKEDLFRGKSTAKIKVEIMFYQSITGTNVAGIIDNQAEKTVIIGAHYDHLGKFESMREDQIANGADDNASGTAGVIELARYIKSKELKHYNYVFALFSGEESGMHGSKHFVKYNSIRPENISFMLNLDMIGRSGCKKAELIIYAVGSSKSWKKQLKKIQSNIEHVNFIAGSSGASDQHSFYQKGIPVLFFFTGIHDDYHEVSDEVELINFKGAADILNYVEMLIENMELCPAPVFRKVGPIRHAISFIGIMFR